MKNKLLVLLVCMLLITMALPALAAKDKCIEPEETAELVISIDITKPLAGNFYLFGNQIGSFPALPFAVCLGPIDLEVNVTSTYYIECVDWYVDTIMEEQITSPPYDWSWPMVSGFAGMHDIEVEILDEQSNSDIDTLKIFKLF